LIIFIVILIRDEIINVIKVITIRGFKLDTRTGTGSAFKQGFIYWKKSETFPKPKFKMEKLCQS
jgi:hypothetical protein